MSALAALFRRELILAARAGGAVLTVVLFFALVGAMVPFAVGPDRELLARLGPGVIWIAALLALLIAVDRLFRDDHDDGSLLAMRLSALPLEALVAARLAAHWLTTAVPLILVTPLIAVLYRLDLGATWLTMVSLAIGTPALVAWAGIGAAVTVTLRRGGLIGPILILPLSVPTLIFGVSAIAPAVPGAATTAMLFLGALSLLAVVIAPFAAALALRLGAE